MVRPPAPAVKASLPVIKLPAQPNAPVPISTATTMQASTSVVKPSPAENQERWDEDSFHGLWDSSDDKGLKSECEFSTSEPALPSSTVPVSPSSGMLQLSKAPLVQQTVDYGHGHGRGQGE